MSDHSGFMGKKGRSAIQKVREKSRSNRNRLGASSVTLSLLAVTFPLLIIFANSFDPYQDRQNVGPDLDLNCLAL